MKLLQYDECSARPLWDFAERCQNFTNINVDIDFVFFYIKKAFL